MRPNVIITLGGVIITFRPRGAQRLTPSTMTTVTPKAEAPLRERMRSDADTLQTLADARRCTWNLARLRRLCREWDDNPDNAEKLLAVAVANWDSVHANWDLLRADYDFVDKLITDTHALLQPVEEQLRDGRMSFDGRNVHLAYALTSACLAHLLMMCAQRGIESPRPM